MKKYIYLTFVLTLISLLFMSNRKGRATTVGLGSTGAPGDDATVCQSCHNGPIDVAVQIAVLDQVDTITQYEPNKTYKIHVRIHHIGGNIPRAHGFQMTLLNAPKGQTGPNLKDISPISSNVKLVTPRNGRLYAEQTDRSDTNLFEIQWKAPAAGAGPVTIYAGGNGVNANGNESGDGASKTSLQLNEKLSSATATGHRLDIQIYPNPFAEQFVVRGQTEGIRRIDLLDLFGKSVKTLHFSEAHPMVDLGELADGIYFAKFFDQDLNLVKTQKLMKRSLRP